MAFGMSRQAQVLLPKRHSVRFPDRCPVCGKSAPGHSAKLAALLGPLRPLSNDVLARWQPTLAVCREHERRIRIARFSDQVAWVGLSLAYAFVSGVVFALLGVAALAALGAFVGMIVFTTAFYVSLFFIFADSFAEA